MKTEKIEKLLCQSGLKVKFNEPLSRHTTLHVGGPAKFYVEVYTLNQLKFLLTIVKEYKIPLFVIGAGSNLLVNDNGFNGIVFRLKGEFAEINFSPVVNSEVNGNHPEAIFNAGGGSMLPLLVKRSIDEEYSGLEMLAGIPGTIGGAIVMNSGTHFGNISDVISRVKIIDLSGKISILKKEEITFSYRSSSLEGKIVLSAEFKLVKSKRDEILKKVTENMLYRAKTQPLGVYSAGSIFKNPPNKYAGELIEKSGLKNYRIGGAIVSDKHANFIVNSGNATFSDIQQLITYTRNKVYEKFGVQLELEIKVL